MCICGSQFKAQWRIVFHTFCRPASLCGVTDSTFMMSLQDETVAAELVQSPVYHALELAASSDSLKVQQGTKQLQAWETQQGFYTFLQVSRHRSKARLRTDTPVLILT